MQNTLPQQPQSMISFRLGFYTVISFLLLIFSQQSVALTPIKVNGEENGIRMHGKFEIWHDISANASSQIALQALNQQQFSQPIDTKSTGLKAGTFWSHFTLKNTTDSPITIHIEYVDHQLIGLDAFLIDSKNTLQPIAQLALDKPFEQRQIAYNRFVFAVELAPFQSANYLAKFSSDGMGFVFPNLRIWSPANLKHIQLRETAATTFLLGGVLLMAIFSLIGGITTKQAIFYTYSVYAFSKLVGWSTIFGYTHQFVITDGFHWSYMSMSGAFTILAGLVFSRTFLQTKTHTPKIDIVLKLMMLNASFLFVCAIFKLTSLTIISITVALLLFPMLIIAGLVRWHQGSTEGAMFAAAWSFLVTGLLIQAFRDLGFVEHSFINYYWPPIASYAEMLVIMAAIGLQVKNLQKQKLRAERQYSAQLKTSTQELEKQVAARTVELEEAKLLAEQEARTDALTGVRNRRSFFAQASRRMKECISTGTYSPNYSLLMFDIDNFKQINDNHGHAVGDEALKAFASVISQNIQTQDVFGRIGGEEFTLLLCTHERSAKEMAISLKNAVADIAISTENGALNFTTSIGIAHVSKNSPLETALNLADKALYIAKTSGRNRVEEHKQT